MTKIMGKIVLLLIVVSTLKGFGQTYNLTVTYNTGYCGSNSTVLAFEMYGSDTNNNHTSIETGQTDQLYKREGDLTDYRSSNLRVNPHYINISRFESISIKIDVACLDLEDQCNIHPSKSIPFVDLLKGGVLNCEGCRSGVAASNLKPNGLSIKNAENFPEICAGELLNLSASHITNIVFPDDVYHWQYSLNNQATWVDLPYPFNLRKNNLFTIQEILGSTHDRYFNKQIYFRLGYGQNNSFTTPLAITYSPCAPEIYIVDVPNPVCNESPIPDVTISFKRDLKEGELLKYLCIVKSTDESSILYQYPSDINQFEGPLPYKTFTITNLSCLENSGTYRIRYQAFKGTANKGIQYSEPFTYTRPTPLKYGISNWTQPSCLGSNDGSIEIQVDSGTTPYNFYIDNIKITPTIENGKYYLRGLTGKSDGYKIIVTDKNGCYEKE